jgi:hypothetical protein
MTPKYNQEHKEKIGIYGDSWADPNHGHDYNPLLAKKAWCNRFGQADIYAKGGSSIYFSYRLFIETHEQYDRVIFIATNPGRWHLPIKTKDSEFHLNAPGTVKYFRDHGHKECNLKMTAELDSKLHALEQFYLELSDFDTDQEICSLMIDRIMAVRPDTILVMSHNTGWYNDWSLLSKYYMPMCESFGQEYKNKAEHNHGVMPYPEKNLVCHMTAETNEIVYNHMVHRLQHGTWPNSPFTIQHQHNPDYYWNMT